MLAAPPGGAGDDVVRVLAAAARAVAGGGDGAGEVRVPVGVGVPGLVDRRGMLRFAPHLAGARELDVGGALSSLLGCPVVVDNDATCAAWAEHRLPAGAAAGVDDVVLVTLGTGIGAGFVLGGRLHRGAHGFAGEVGHVVVDPDGPHCPCGKRGCWERFASGSALVAMAADAGLDETTAAGIAARAAAGDDVAAGVLAVFAHWVGVGLAGLVDTLDPAVVVVGGGVVEAGAVLVDLVGDAMWSAVEAPAHRPRVPVVPASLGPRAGAVGAALLACG